MVKVFRSLLIVSFPSRKEISNSGKIALPFFPVFDQDTVVIFTQSSGGEVGKSYGKARFRGSMAFKKNAHETSFNLNPRMISFSRLANGRTSEPS